MRSVSFAACAIPLPLVQSDGQWFPAHHKIQIGRLTGIPKSQLQWAGHPNRI